MLSSSVLYPPRGCQGTSAEDRPPELLRVERHGRVLQPDRRWRDRTRSHMGISQADVQVYAHYRLLVLLRGAVGLLRRWRESRAAAGRLLRRVGDQGRYGDRQGQER